MMAVIQRHRLLIIVMSLVLFILLLWVFVSRLNTNRIPSRGVFVIQECVSGHTA